MIYPDSRNLSAVIKKLWESYEVSRPVYVMQEIDGQNVTDAVLKKADGIVIRTRWSTIEPTKGKFNLKWVKAQLARAKKFGKKVQLEVLSGDDAPKWLAQNGCQVYKINSSSQIPVPWDMDFITHYTNMISYIAQNLDWVDITHFHLPGADNAEWHYSQFNSGGFYKVAGYSDDKMVSAHKSIAYYTGAIFEKHAIETMLVSDIGDHDRAWTITAMAELAVLDVGFQMDALKASTSTSYKGYIRIKEFGDRGIPVGFEMVGPSVTRSGSAVSRFGGKFQSAIDKANKTKAQWLIVYQDDLRFLPF